jgi:hypothetical protein
MFARALASLSMSDLILTVLFRPSYTAVEFRLLSFLPCFLQTTEQMMNDLLREASLENEGASESSESGQ